MLISHFYLTRYTTLKTTFNAWRDYNRSHPTRGRSTGLPSDERCSIMRLLASGEVPAISCQPSKIFSKEIHYKTAEYNNSQSNCIIDHNRGNKSCRERPPSKKFRKSVCPEISENGNAGEHFTGDRFVAVNSISPDNCCHSNKLTPDERISKGLESKREGIP